MFKNATTLKITSLPIAATVAEYEEEAAFQQFQPLQGSQERAVGWAPARSQDYAARVERIDGHQIMRFMCESKAVPASAIAAKAKEHAKKLLETTGRKPGKTEMRDIKDTIKADLMVHALPRLSSTLVWIDRKNMRLVLDTASQSRADEIVSLLVNTFEGLAVGVIDTELAPTTIMESWLLDQGKLSTHEMFDFALGRACKLQASDESKAIVSYKNHTLDIDEVRQHILQGKAPVALALTYDDRVSFVLTAGGQITKIKFLDVVFSDIASEDMGDFDTDVAIMTGEISALIDGLVESLGGEVAA